MIKNPSLKVIKTHLKLQKIQLDYIKSTWTII